MIFRGGSMAVTLVTDDALHADRVRRVADGPAADRREIATPTELVDLIGRTGYSRFRLSRLLDRLATHYLAGTDRRDRWQLRGRTHTSGTKLGRAARTLDVLGLLTARARRYTIERAAWAWW